MRTISYAAATLFIMCISLAGPAPAQEAIFCEGVYGGHLQGIAAQAGTALYWSFTVELVKTDMNGSFITSVPVEDHHGDLAFHDNKLYVAVNLGEFNREPGHADSWIYVYDADNLDFLSRHEAQEAVHGAGGIAVRDGRFYVVGGLPEGYTENYVYEYDEAFHFVKRHVVDSGYTLMGIQTAFYGFGHFWFGCYGHPDNKPLIITDANFMVRGAYDTDFSVGIDASDESILFRGITWTIGERKYWRGRIVKENLVDILDK